MFLRSVHPKYFVDGELLGRGFLPTEADAGLLSGYDRSLATPEQAFIHRTEVMKKAAAGIWGVTFAELDEVEMPHSPRPSDASPAHMHLDFNSTVEKAWRMKAQMLAELASGHGILHPTGAAEQLSFPVAE